MKVTFEVENDEELKKLMGFIKDMKANININQKSRENKLKDLFDFADENPLSKEKLDIPNRDERNAR